MSDKNLARRSTAEVSFDGANITKSILPYLISLTYTDNEADETDDLQIKLQDRDSIWLEQWLEKAIQADVSAKSISSSSSSLLPAGTKLTLKNVKGYVSSTTGTSFGTKFGTFYTWDDEVIRGRVRITNALNRVGVANQVTCWISFSDAVAASGKSVTTTAQSSSSGGLVAGTMLALKSVKGYVSSDASQSFGTKTGTFYAWDDKVIRGRIRITNRTDRVGMAGQVTCWIDLADATVAAGSNSDGQTTAVSPSGLSIQAVITRQNWNGDGKDKILNCGQFELDSVDASGPPSTITIKATSLPYSTQIRQTKKTKAWESYNLSGIAKEMAASNSMTCMYLSNNDPHYKRVEQYNVSDINFLSTLCRSAGISLKVTNNIIVLFDQASYEAKTSVLTIRRGDHSYTKWKLSTGTADTKYTSCRVRYTNSSGRCIEGIARVEDYNADSKTNQQLEIKAKVSSIAEANALAEKYLRLHNKYEKTASFTMPGNPDLVAGVTVKLESWGAWNGKYIISQAKHTISSSGYTTQIQVRKVLEGY